MRPSRIPSLALVTLALACSSAVSQDAPAPARGGEAAPAVGGERPAPVARPRVELAFVLDTTGSMGGLIDSARRKIWAIANEIARAKPTPDLRIGLVAFRDRGDEYVTRVHDLDADLDRVYATLCAYRADGGGDGPEGVNEGLRAGVTKLSWSRETAVLKVLFLVGDAPPHMDYAQDVPYPRTCEEAARAGILVNTLRCGGDPTTERVWAEIARLAEGRYASLPQEGGATALATPYDTRLAELGASLGGTFLAYGRREARKAAEDKMERSVGLVAASGAASAPAAPAADRASVLGKGGRLDDADLVAAVEEGRLEVETLKDEDLPEGLRRLDAAGRREAVAKKLEERRAIRVEIGALEKKRATFVEEATRKAATAGTTTFDQEVTKILREQASKKGWKFE